MTRLLILLLSVALFFSCGRPKQTPDNRITIGSVDSVYSETLKEMRKIWVYKPESFDDTTGGRKYYPVLYLLDGPSHFHAVTGLLNDMARNRICPEMIVVAIPNTDRSRDLTPTHSLLMTDGKPQKFLENSGGGEKFTAFIEKELIPYVESHYPTAPYRTLIGHSFGGLFAINTLIHHPDVFNAYISIDPSMWWDKQKLLRQSDSVLKARSFDKKILYVSVANTMPKGMDTVTMITDTTGNSFHIRSIFRFVSTAEAGRKSGLRFASRYYDNDDHGSVPLISEYDGLRFIFDYYKLKHMESMSLGEVDAHFKMVSEKLGYDFPPPMDIIQTGGYLALRTNRLDEALKFFTRNVERYPKISFTYDDLGEYYLAAGDTTKAIELFEKTLSMEDHPGIREKVDGLKKAKTK